MFSLEYDQCSPAYPKVRCLILLRHDPATLADSQFFTWPAAEDRLVTVRISEVRQYLPNENS